MDGLTVVTDREAVHAASRNASQSARVPVEIRIRVTDPFDAYRRARTDGDGFFLETTGGQAGWGYFGIEPESRLTVGPDAVSTIGESPSLSALETLLADEHLVRAGCEIPYPCGAFGWLSYDVSRELESLPAEVAADQGLPRLQLGVFDRVAAWREPRDEETILHVVACPRIGDDPDAAYERGRRRAESLVRRIREGDPAVTPSHATYRSARFESECGREAFAKRVRTVQRYIRDGDTFQANISHRLAAPTAVHPVETYAALRRVNPAPYSGLLEFPGVDLVSASPELLFAIDGERIVTEPIAGTRPRGENPTEDAALEAELLADEKERAEHAMLVDLERNDLGKVCAYGSVEVSEYRRVDRYSEVMHLVSVVEGILREETTTADAVAAVFPGGTITGAPKPRTMEIIDELEDTARGPYTGSVLALGFDGRATGNIIIRTLVRHGDRYYLRVGAGIVHDSVPEREYDETMAKARALITAVDEALGERADLEVAQ